MIRLPSSSMAGSSTRIRNVCGTRLGLNILMEGHAGFEESCILLVGELEVVDLRFILHFFMA